MDRTILSAVLSLFFLFNIETASAYQCTATGTGLNSAKISKGKVGPFKAYVKNGVICVLAIGKCSYVRPNGKVYRNGRQIGRINCSFSKLRAAVEGR